MDVRITNPFAFVVMPFGAEFNEVYQAIRGACDELGVRCERVDEQLHTQNIMERIYEQIREADLVIADTSEARANVYYEAGYARSAGKQVIHLTQDSFIPFNLSQYPHIQYSSSGPELDRLRDQLKRYIADRLVPRETPAFASADLPVLLFNKGSGRCLDVPYEPQENGELIQPYVLNGRENQIWHLVPVGGGAFRIESLNSRRKCLSVEGDSLESGAPIVQWDYHGTPSQQWWFRMGRDGGYQITNVASRKCLAVAGASTENRASIIQYDCLNGDDQRWWIHANLSIAD